MRAKPTDGDFAGGCVGRYAVRSADVPCRLFAHPGGEPDWRDAVREATQITAAIGPEGGWTDEEAGLAMENGRRAIDLGPRIFARGDGGGVGGGVGDLKRPEVWRLRLRVSGGSRATRPPDPTHLSLVR